MEERKKQRDSIRDAKKAEFEARRQKLIEDRQKRLDSLAELRNGNNGGKRTTIGGWGRRWRWRRQLNNFLHSIYKHS